MAAFDTPNSVPRHVLSLPPAGDVKRLQAAVDQAVGLFCGRGKQEAAVHKASKTELYVLACMVQAWHLLRKYGGRSSGNDSVAAVRGTNQTRTRSFVISFGALTALKRL
eukprot:TRINITY_DN6649_c0_g1_i1.p2 TRINITY_DN6649_c0_g1~~TRINITY_DN6649_c0_g1_i1.p2  ORF type:complete len:109 (+),score=14.80 TRINITY_DN6649_c0_g1_i1:43-369(+)